MRIFIAFDPGDYHFNGDLPDLQFSDFPWELRKEKEERILDPVPDPDS